MLILFDLRQSNLPLSAAFPILMSNMLGYLEPANQATQRDLRPGQHRHRPRRCRRRGDRGAAAGRPEPDVPVRGPPDPVLGDLAAGLYTVLQRAAGQTLLEELLDQRLDERESDVRPKPIRRGSAHAPGRTPHRPVPMNREIWMGWCRRVLALLLFEWFWFHRKS